MSGRLTFEDVYRPLVDGVRGVNLSTAPELLTVRCGLGQGSGRRCGKVIGHVVGSPHGLAWRPATELPEPSAMGAPMLLPTSPPEARQHFCELIYSKCQGGHNWYLAVTELKRRVRNGNPKVPYYVLRAIPDEWGPLVNDPIHWTAQDWNGAVAALIEAGGGGGGGGGDRLTGIEESRTRARAQTLAAILTGTGPYLDRIDLVREVLGTITGGEHTA